MAEIGLYVDVHEITELQKKARDLAHGKRMERILTGARKILLADIGEHWDRAQTPSGKPWAPRTRAYPWRPLQKSGDMRDALDVKTSHGAKAGRLFAFFKNDSVVRYAQAMIFGIGRAASKAGKSRLGKGKIGKGRGGPRKTEPRNPIGLSKSGYKDVKKHIDSVGRDLE